MKVVAAGKSDAREYLPVSVPMPRPPQKDALTTKPAEGALDANVSTGD